ncbi:MAG: double zinc ribbon domain-containing protein [Bergeyella zoohelcum]|nr:double zinc ribbon domain-containing protein [Bergeyella zoohelcum]
MIIDLLFPDRCVGCNRIINSTEIICPLCYSHLHLTHWDFTKSNELKEKCLPLFPVENAFGLMHFTQNSLSRKIIHELKYKKREKIGQFLAQLTTHYLNFKDKKPDLLVSVPLHTRKEKERGYNQLHAFTEYLSGHYGIPFNHYILKRNAYKTAQALKDKSERKSTDSLFSLTQNIENQHILLIDDVFTTGNTLSSIAWEFLKKGNNKISILVMAVDE